MAVDGGLCAYFLLQLALMRAGCVAQHTKLQVYKLLINLTPPKPENQCCIQNDVWSQMYFPTSSMGCPNTSARSSAPPGVSQWLLPPTVGAPGQWGRALFCTTPSAHTKVPLMAAASPQEGSKQPPNHRHSINGFPVCLHEKLFPLL